MKFWTSITATALLGVLIAQLALFLPFTLDDAYITFSYAKNFVTGHGLVFSRGDRVEATSSLLWALLLIPFEALVSQGAVIGSKILGTLSICGTVWAGTLLIRDVLKNSKWRGPLYLAFSFAVLMNSSFMTWSTYGMENGLLAFLLMSAVVLFIRESTGKRGTTSAFVLVLIEMCRPEGFMFVAIFAALRLLESASRPTGETRAHCRLWFLVLIGGVLGYEAFGFLYYGYLLPNSATAKIVMAGADAWRKGIDYLGTGSAVSFVALYCLASILIPLAVLLDRSDRSSYPQVASLFWLCVTAQISFTVLSGGDWMVNARFLSHMAPLLLTLVILTIWRIVTTSTRFVSSRLTRYLCGLGALCGILLYAKININYARDSWNWQNFLQMAEMRGIQEMTHKLNELDPAGMETVACSDIGRMGYFYGGRVMDWAGLADEEIAHRHITLSDESASIILARGPTFLVLYSNKPILDAAAMEFGEALHSRAFFKNPVFSVNYEQIFVLPFWPNRYQVLFKRKNSSH